MPVRNSSDSRNVGSDIVYDDAGGECQEPSGALLPGAVRSLLAPAFSRGESPGAACSCPASQAWSDSFVRQLISHARVHEATSPRLSRTGTQGQVSASLMHVYTRSPFGPRGRGSAGCQGIS